ncbi:uncharacterized protein QC761_105875 [Podospora bellae-mahoneyi]|uniref:Uncharacterized protein n=1 Tax=Podospora bellae-mahoneyi TaxID=2093777 RepID=A0ABR0FY00_9PEZI|nr:hypothetical protein QC761_105875 [Podospora bellae-mahoneyi]
MFYKTSSQLSLTFFLATSVQYHRTDPFQGVQA